VFLRKSSDALDLLTEAKLERRFRPPPGSLAALYGGYYVAELVNELTDQYDPHPELFDLCAQALVSLSQDQDVASVILRFELELLRMLGHQPALEHCAECGSTIARDVKLAFGMLHGGMLCPRCRGGKRHVVLLSPDAWNLLRSASRDTDQTPEAPLARQGSGEARAVMNRYVTHLVGHPLKMHELI
jgi:DNA repair protein RecO (recombination protein O)